MASDWLEAPENRRRFIQYAKSLGIVTLDEYESPSANSTGGHLDLDFTDYNGGGNRKLNFAERQRTMSNVRSKLRQRRAAEKERIDNFTDGMINTIYSWQQQGVPRAQAEQQIRQMAGANIAMGKEMLNALDYFYSGDSKGMESWQIDAVNDALAAGQFQNSQEYIQYLQRSGANQKQLYEANKTYQQWRNGEGDFAYDWNSIKDEVCAGLKDDAAKMAWRDAQARGKLYIAEFTAKNKRQPTRYELVEYLREGNTKHYYGAYRDGSEWFFSNWLELSDNRLAASGIGSVERIDNDLYDVHYLDGRREQMNAYRLHLLTRW